VVPAVPGSDPELYNIIGLAVSSGGKNKSCLKAQAIGIPAKGTNPWQMILQDIRIRNHDACLCLRVRVSTYVCSTIVPIYGPYPMR